MVVRIIFNYTGDCESYFNTTLNYLESSEEEKTSYIKECLQKFREYIIEKYKWPKKANMTL